MSKFHFENDRVTIPVTYNNREFQSIDYDITMKPVSVHYPLTRLLTGLFVEFGRLGLPISSANFTALDVLQAADKSMRVLALCAQVKLTF